MVQQIMEHRKGFGPEVDRLRASPQTLVTQVQTKRIEEEKIIVGHDTHQALPKVYLRLMTWCITVAYPATRMERPNYKFAFVIQFRPETDVEAGQFTGKVEHIASYEATSFSSLEELLSFIVRMLSEAGKTE